MFRLIREVRLRKITEAKKTKMERKDFSFHFFVSQEKIFRIYYNHNFLMLISEFDFELPENLIAQEPLEKRENSRMLVLDRSEKRSRTNIFTIFRII